LACQRRTVATPADGNSSLYSDPRDDGRAPADRAPDVAAAGSGGVAHLFPEQARRPAALVDAVLSALGVYEPQAAGRNPAMSHIIGRPNDDLLDIMLGHGADPEQAFIGGSEQGVEEGDGFEDRPPGDEPTVPEL
jgi:hypothetical protein